MIDLRNQSLQALYEKDVGNVKAKP